jgi:hypothetical protein
VTPAVLDLKIRASGRSRLKRALSRKTREAENTKAAKTITADNA